MARAQNPQLSTKACSLKLAAVALAFLLVACTPAALPAIPAGDPAHPVVIAIAPAAGLSSKAADELAAQLKDKTGLSFITSLHRSSGEAVGALGSGKAQIGWVDALGYVVARKRYGTEVGLVAVRRGSHHFSSQIIANARMGIKTLGDLRGQTFCFAASPSLGGHTIPRIILQANGVDPSRDLKITKVDRDEQIAAAVYSGVDCVAGATVEDAYIGLQKQHPDVEEKILVLETSFAIPNDAIVFVKGFPANMRTQITDALDALSQSLNGRGVLHVEGLVRQSDSAYDRLRDLLTKAAADPANYIQ